ncbi:MAG: DUF1592 domain-containing protein [Prosthecobacter sp.]|nr:DUF1592 domain-containing protein [Prosthecobacter sp.]
MSLAAGSLQAAPEWKGVQPVLVETCYDCHNATKMKGGVDLKSLATNPGVEEHYALWDKVREVVAKGEMPPEDETPLSAAEKQQVLGWLTQALDTVATTNAGDPGPVTLRRLTNAEYDYTIRDLTGRDYGLAREFMPDGGGGEGFSNTGDVLFVNPAQLDKYLAAARKLVDQATIMPGTGVVFHAQRVGLRGPQQLRGQAEQALYVWYQKAVEKALPNNEEDLREADYMLACWKWKHHGLTGAASLSQLAKEAKLSEIFLQNWWNLLNDERIVSRYLDLTRLPWRALPAPDAANPKAAPAVVLAELKKIQAQRFSWYMSPKKNREGNVQRRQQDADGLRSYPVRAQVSGQRRIHVVVGDTGDGNAGDYVQFKGLSLRLQRKSYEYAPWMRSRRDADQKALKEIESGKPAPAGLDVAALKARIAEADKTLAMFGIDPLGKSISADVLAVKAPGVITLPLPEGVSEVFGSGKLDLQSPDADKATAQWTLALGTPPNPSRIIPGVLTVWKIQTPTARETMGDFGRMKAAFPDSYDRRLEEVARNYTRRSAGPGVYYFSDEQLATILSPAAKEHFRQLKEDWGYVAPNHLSKEQSESYNQLMRKHLQSFAARAWRRPLEAAEAQQLAALYDAGIKGDLDRESAARQVLVRVLVSPNFLHKMEMAPALTGAGENAPADHPLSSWELASRLSYFLWSSMPDEQLRQAAANGSLLKPEVLTTQVKRMMSDPKAEALAREFLGQWLEFAGFGTYSAVDAKKFPQFTPDLRQDLARETTLFFTHLVREDRPVREIIGADYTYLNERLAKHYGVPGVTGEDFRKVSVSAQHRGGLLGQGSVLIKTSRSHRTSPVLRGNWLLQAVLGTPVPPPPADVPELKEHGPKPATVREMLEQHRASKACASCHDRIDPLGFALENFDAIGRYRDKDEAGLPLDTSGQVKDGTKFSGFEGLRSYLATQETQFTNHFCRKLLGYALGRQVLPTDKALTEKMKADLKKDEGRLSAPILAIVQSRQFLNKRL